MKKIMTLLLIATVAFAFAGCNGISKTNDNNEQIAYEKAMSDAGTYEDCKYFINKYPQHKHAGIITKKAEDLAKKENSKYETKAPDITDSQMSLITTGLIDKIQKNNMKSIIIFPYDSKLKFPKSWVGQSIMAQRDAFIDKIGKTLDSRFMKFVINEADCSIPERDDKLDKVIEEISNLLDEKFNLEKADEMIGQLQGADAFIFTEIHVVAVDEKNLDKPFLTETCHNVKFTYTITARLVSVSTGAVIWIQDVPFSHNSYIWRH
ncbi:MAG: hypothetical protein K8S87_10380 [Planctomycetes bacterium]|nr:hypothetical protein [Planctomycetota bacterium]